MKLVLIDTSVWIDLLRSPADADLVRMQKLLEGGAAAWCEMVRLELWAGVRDTKERKQLGNLDDAVNMLNITEQVWQDSCISSGLARSRGITAPPSDHLIYACARIHGAELWHNDKHFDLLARL